MVVVCSPDVPLVPPQRHAWRHVPNEEPRAAEAVPGALSWRLVTWRMAPKDRHRPLLSHPHSRGRWSDLR